jgi:hypothetical protein
MLIDRTRSKHGASIRAITCRTILQAPPKDRLLQLRTNQAQQTFAVDEIDSSSTIIK